MANELDGFKVVAQALTTGTDVEYEIPANVASIALHCATADFDLKHESGGSAWTVLAGTKESFAARTVAGKLLFLNGATGNTVQIMLFFGSMDPT